MAMASNMVAYHACNAGNRARVLTTLLTTLSPFHSSVVSNEYKLQARLMVIIGAKHSIGPVSGSSYS